MKKKTLNKITRSPVRWVSDWARAAGVSRAEFVGMTDDGRARVRIDGGDVVPLSAFDVAEIVGGSGGRGATFEESGALVYYSRVIGWAF